MHLNHIRIVWVIISLSSKINPFELLKEYESGKFARLQCTRPKLVVHYTYQKSTDSFKALKNYNMCLIIIIRRSSGGVDGSRGWGEAARWDGAEERTGAGHGEGRRHTGGV